MDNHTNSMPTFMRIGCIVAGLLLIKAGIQGNQQKAGIQGNQQDEKIDSEIDRLL